MINLEELSLLLAVIRLDSDYINGVQLRDAFLRYMPQMNKFHFSIETTIIKSRSDLVLSSNVDIQRSFIEGQLESVGSHVDVFAKASGRRANTYSMSHDFYSRCHIYSLPYKLTYFPFLSNSFQNGTFERVRTLSVADAQPFKSDFFRIISQSFPLLRSLHVLNNMPQESTQQAREVIAFTRLHYLDLASAHVHYATQFLIDEHCRLPCLQRLEISWVSLVAVTHDFTNAATRRTCSQLKSIHMSEPFVRPERFHHYFSSL